MGELVIYVIMFWAVLWLIFGTNAGRILFSLVVISGLIIGLPLALLMLLL